MAEVVNGARQLSAAHPPPHAASQHVYIVGGEDYVAREIRRRLHEKGVGVSGHAPRWWEPRFDYPRFTTTVLIVDDDAPTAMKIHAARQATKQRIPVCYAPARNHWSEAERILMEQGIIPKPGEQLAPTVAPDTAPITTPLAEKVAAAVAAQPPAADAEVARAAPPADLTPADNQEKDDMVNIPPSRYAAQLLRETKGAFGNEAVAQIVHSKTKGKISRDEVQEIRQHLGLPAAKRGTPSAAVREMLAKYGIARKDPATFLNSRDAIEKRTAARKNGVEKKAASEPRKVEAPPTHEQEKKVPGLRAKPVATGGGDGSPGDLAATLRAALEEIREQVVIPFNIAGLELAWRDGKWHVGKVERAVIRIVEEKVEL